MYLKSIRVQGFKTFARRTDLPFSRGITAIVGPNGSGKSNLVDAIRWALGERNARGLRGHRMEDVIYAGGPGKSAVGMAEVTLLIDNADQRLNVEFTEVEVARRLYRSGESEYLVNGARARLRDIDALLASTGLRQDGYAVTAQNDIDYVIQAAPAVRRELIEEAAGVRRLRDQRQEAVTRLAEAERDMRRARDLLEELTPRAQELRAQALAAQEYQATAEQLKALQGSLLKDAWRKAMVQLRRARSREQSAAFKQAEAAAALADFEPRYAEHRDALLRAREARWSHQQGLAESRLRLAESEHQVRIADERAQAVAQALQVAHQELERLTASERAGSRVVEELERSVDALREQLEAARAAAAAGLMDESRSAASHRRLEDVRAELLRRRQDLHRERLAMQAESRQLEGRSLFLHEQRQNLLDEIQAWAQRQDELERELEDRARAVEGVQEDLRRRRLHLDQLERRLDEETVAYTELEREAAESGAQRQAREAEVGGLRLLQERMQQASPLGERAGAQLRRLVEMLAVQPPHRAAVEAVLEGLLSGWVTADPVVVDWAVGLIASTEGPRETVLFDPGWARDLGVPPGLRSLRSVIEAPPSLDALLSHLLERVVLVDSLAEARAVLQAAPELQAVTVDGELLTAWCYRGGRTDRAPLQAHAQLREAEDAWRQAVAADEQARRRLDAARVALEMVRGERAAAAAELDRERGHHGELAGRLAAVRAAAERDAEQGRRLEDQLNRIATLVEQTEGALAEVRRRQDEAARSEEASVEELPLIESALEAAAAELAQTLKRRQDLELRAALLDQRQDDLLRQLGRAQEVWRSHGDDLAQRAAAAAELEAQPARLTEDRAASIRRLEEARLELAALDAVPLPDASALSAMEAQVREDEQRNVSLQVECAHTDDALSAARVEVETAQAEVDRCAHALREDPQALSEEDAGAEVDWQKTEREVSRLQRRLDAMGAVNLLAPEEYAQVNDRCQSLQSQLDDLEAAATQLVELRKRLEHEIDERFRTVFQSVAINFQEFFGELFPGGRATLRLEDQVEDPLDEGVEILAQTPGKRLQPLTLLSGGERALTALAFLFALQAVNPSPFYVLDEVDAALDDANVVRFNRVLSRLARDQQFLVVTHNHSTMAQAEVLYGVTLGEHGVSRIVSVRLQQDEAVPRLSERSA
ncbi:MAG TPA: chromosome segregation protein SMC [Candidatus Limnocylindrales bacterium]|nr:chromosome segregation protein SMC [Candidatus Limnocylindrales bacterium]